MQFHPMSPSAAASNERMRVQVGYLTKADHIDHEHAVLERHKCEVYSLHPRPQHEVCLVRPEKVFSGASLEGLFLLGRTS